ncbi:MAG TPA: hypothetical protein VGO31_00540 [Microbacteriaceae bacterium]|jgi:hypothetical protein|nr:hypothetical protein [Microbacteriaceae bacterium]
MSINTTQIAAQAFRAVSDLEFQATMGRIGTHAVGLGRELIKALTQWRNLQ